LSPSHPRKRRLLGSHLFGRPGSLSRISSPSPQCQALNCSSHHFPYNPLQRPFKQTSHDSSTKHQKTSAEAFLDHSSSSLAVPLNRSCLNLKQVLLRSHFYTELSNRQCGWTDLCIVRGIAWSRMVTYRRLSWFTSSWIQRCRRIGIWTKERYLRGSSGSAPARIG